MPRHLPRYLALLLCLSLALSACQGATPTPLFRTPLPSRTPTRPPATATRTPTPAPTGTATSTPTPPPTATFTPTPLLLVEAETPLPQPLDVISIGNAQDVSGLAEWKERNVTDIAWTPDGQMLAVASAEGIALYDVPTRTLLRRLYPHRDGIVDLSFSPNASWLVAASLQGTEQTGYSTALELWKGPDWRPYNIFYGTYQGLTDAQFSPDSRNYLVAYATPGYPSDWIQFWNVASWTVTNTLTMTLESVQDIVISPNSSTLAVSPDRYAIDIWDIKKQDQLYTLYTSFTGAVNKMTFSPNGLFLASGHYDGLIRIWDLATGHLLQTLEGEGVIESLTYTADNLVLVTGSGFDDTNIRLWDIENGVLLHTLPGHKTAVTHLLFSPDGQLLVSASYDGTLRLWGVRP